MVVIGSMIGNRGLGMEVLLAINRVNIGQGFEAATGEDAETEATEEAGEKLFKAPA